MLIEFLGEIDPKDKHKTQFAQKLIREWYDRAMRKSDCLMIEILNRIDGKLGADAELQAKDRVEPLVVVMDLPCPPGSLLIPGLTHAIGKPKPDPNEE